MASIGQFAGNGRDNTLDLVVVGGGPAGISASLAATESKLRFVTVEQDSLGGTVAHFPRGKVVMTQPATLPLYGRVGFREIGKEKLIAFWKDVIAKTGLQIRFGERVEAVVPMPGGVRGQDHTRRLSHPIRTSRDRTSRHAAPPGRSGRRAEQSRLSPDRCRAVPQTACPRCGRRRQRARGGQQHRGATRHDSDPFLPRRIVCTC